MCKSMVYTIKLKFNEGARLKPHEKKEYFKDIIHQDVNLELKQNPHLFGADEVWLDEVEDEV